MGSTLAAPLSARKLVALDGVRGLAIAAVMLHHLAPALAAPGPATRAVVRALHFGWFGVDLFFVLSGFLITGILLDTREAPNYFSSFYARRALRIFPLAYGFLIFGFLVFPHVVEAGWLPLPADRWLYFCYLTNWLPLWKGTYGPNVLGHFWSLAIEEQFYMAWPLCVWLLRPRWLMPSLVAAEIATVVMRVAWVLTYGTSQAVSWATITRLDGLLLGAICAVLVRRASLPQAFKRSLPGMALLGMAAFFTGFAITGTRSDLYLQTTGFPLLALAFAAFVLYAVITEGGAGWPQRFLRWRPLTNWGKYAYGIYVFHVPIFYFRAGFVATRTNLVFSWISAILICAITYQVARASYNGFERRFLSYKDRFAPRLKPISLTARDAA